MRVWARRQVGREVELGHPSKPKELIIWPILLHASTDPSIYLWASYPADGPLTGIAGLGNVAVIATGLILLIFIRGRVTPSGTTEIGTRTPS